MSTSPMRWAIVGSAVLLLAASLVLRRTHSVDLEYEVEANYLDVVAGFADIGRYPELTGGRAQRGEIHRSEERTDASGNRIVEVSYSVWAAGSENTGERVYTYFADRPYVTIDLEFYSARFREDTHIVWTLEDVGGTTRIEGRGTRTAPWLLSLFSIYHNKQVLLVFERIGRELTAHADVVPAPDS